MIQLIQGDCLIKSDKIESGSVDLILTDLPYGTIKGLYDNTEWDNIIDIGEIMNVCSRILRQNGTLLLFCQEPFTTHLRTKSIPNILFKQKLIWEKDSCGNMQMAKSACVSFYEDILMFRRRDNPNDNNEARNYFREQRELVKNIPYKKINELCFNSASNGGGIASNILTVDKKNWIFPNKERYEALRKIGICNKPFEEIEAINAKHKIKVNTTFNLWEGKKYKSNILKYKKDYDGHHPTQKPVLLLEDLIKTFSNENDLVVDLTMGSGSTGVAAKNTNRSFIGIEQDPNYFKIAEERINKQDLFTLDTK